MGQMALQLFAQMAAPDYQFSGLYGNNRQRAMQQELFAMSHRAAMQRASQMDQNVLMDYHDTIARATNTKLTDNERKALTQFNSKIANAAASGLVDPRTLDIVSGGRSAINLAHFAHLGGKARMDPVTGWSGTSGATSAHIGMGLWQHYYGDQRDEKGNLIKSGAELGLSRSAGLTSYQMGELHGELARRGMIGAVGSDRMRTLEALSTMDSGQAETALRKIGINPDTLAKDSKGRSRLDGISDKDLKKLRDDSNVQDQLRSNEAGRVAQALDKYKGSIAAVKEIFGDMGHPDAPMQQLFAAMEELTHGTVQQLNPNRVEATIRNLYNVSKVAEVGIDGLRTLMQHSGKFAADHGMNPYFATQMTGGALAALAARNQTGMNEVTAWGLMTPDMMVAADQERRGRFINSQSFNSMSAILRVADQYGAANLSEEARTLISNAKNGIADPRFANMDEGAVADWMANNMGITQRQASTALNSRRQNEEYGAKNNIARLSEQMQREVLKEESGMIGAQEVYGTMSDTFGRALTKKEGDYALQLSTDIADYMANLKPEERRNEKLAAASTADAMFKRMKESEEGSAFLQALGPDDETRRKKLAQMVIEHKGRVQQELEETGQAAPYIENTWSMLDKGAEKRSKEIVGEVEAESVLQSMAAGKTTMAGDAFTRLFQSLQMEGKTAGDQKSMISGVLAKTFGGQIKSEYADELAGRLVTLHGQLGAIDQEKTQLAEQLTAGKITKEQYEVGLSNLSGKEKAAEKYYNETVSYMDEKGLTDIFGAKHDPEAGGDKSVNFDIKTVNLNGTPVLNNASASTTGAASGGGRRKAPVP